MTQLASLAGAKKLTGKVTITDRDGLTYTYADEDEAYEAWKTKLDTLEHRRGAFFQKPAETKPRPKVELAVEAEPSDRKRSGKRKRSSSSDE